VTSLQKNFRERARRFVKGKNTIENKIGNESENIIATSSDKKSAKRTGMASANLFRFDSAEKLLELSGNAGVSTKANIFPSSSDRPSAG